MLKYEEVKLFESLYGNLPEDSFPEKIYKLRKINGMSLESFAEKVGVHISTIKAWEEGSKAPNKRSIKKICDTFGLDTIFEKDLL